MRFLVGFALLAVCASGQPLRSLKTVAVRPVPGVESYVRDQAALVALGKALFWDMQTGSDGRTACASCHFHAGADHRPQNQISDPLHPFSVNLPLAQVAFPLRELSDPGNRNSAVLRDSGMRIGSAGSLRRLFHNVIPGNAAEEGADGLDTPEFMLDGLQVRRVTARNAQSVINAVFSERGFWDGRAQRVFNGFNPSGANAETPGLLEWNDGVLAQVPVRLDNSALASQAVGPIMDPLEMSYAGRTWPDLARKLFNVAPLAQQRVSVNDSVLGFMARAGGPGLDGRLNYYDMVKAAFQPSLWAAPESLADGFLQAERNFSFFWGVAIQAYESTLVSNDSPVDRFLEGDTGALTAEEQQGMRIFQNNGRCTNCHGGAELSAASFSSNNNRAFQRTGVRPAAEDNGAGNATFKSIGLRNVEFTGPYFHNGGQATLEQVVDFYTRAGDFTPTNNIRTFRLGTADKAALVAFLKALSDDRVRYERAPFDHPELCVPVGHVEVSPGVLAPGEPGAFARSAAEIWRSLPAVGAGGNQAPLRTFDELLRGVGANGGRAHLLDETCTAPLP